MLLCPCRSRPVSYNYVSTHPVHPIDGRPTTNAGSKLWQRPWTLSQLWTCVFAMSGYRSISPCVRAYRPADQATGFIRRAALTYPDACVTQRGTVWPQVKCVMCTSMDCSDCCTFPPGNSFWCQVSEYFTNACMLMFLFYFLLLSVVVHNVTWNSNHLLTHFEQERNFLFLWNLKARVGLELAISDFPSRQH